MLIDNFNKFPFEWKQWEFYFIQIIERKKDKKDAKGINGSNHARTIQNFSVSSQEELEKRIPQIKRLCKEYTARAYMHPARRTDKEVSLKMMELLVEHLQDNKHRLDRLYEHACGLSKGVERLWILDYDLQDICIFQQIISEIETWLKENKKNYKPWFSLPTKNGFHYIVEPFDKRILQKYDWAIVSIQTNNPTLLYFENEE